MAATTQQEPEISEKNIASHDIDVEKSNSHEKQYPDTKDESDDSSVNKQAGVKAIEAVTTVWDKKALWLMFVL